MRERYDRIHLPAQLRNLVARCDQAVPIDDVRFLVGRDRDADEPDFDCAAASGDGQDRRRRNAGKRLAPASVTLVETSLNFRLRRAARETRAP
jgi:hypothetical protein